MIEASSNPRPHGPSVVPSADRVRLVPAPGGGLPAAAGILRRLAAGPILAVAAASFVLLDASLSVATAQSPAGGAKEPAVAAPATAPAAPSPAVLRDARFDNGVVAVVDGDPITLRDLKQYGIQGAPFLPPDVRNDYRALLDSMIEARLLRAEFQKNGITAPDEMVDRYIAGVLRENNQSRQQLEIDIAKLGLTWKDYFERMREEVQRIQLINLLIRSRVNVPEEEVREAWEKDPRFLESEKLVVAAIFIPSPLVGDGAEEGRRKALEVQKQARRDFAEAAREHSRMPGASEGGTLGEFTRGSMASHFEEALKGLRKGEVSQPVEGAGGFYIVKLVDIKSSGRRPFEEVKEQLADQLYEERMSERYGKWVNEDLRRDHRIDNLVDSLALIAARSTGETGTAGR